MRLYARDIWHLYEVGALMGQRFRCVKELNAKLTNHTCKGEIGIVVDNNAIMGMSPTCFRLALAFRNRFGVEFIVHLKPKEIANYFELVEP